MIKEAIIKLVNKGDLTYEEAKQVMLEIMGGKTTPTQNAAFLADEIVSLATPVPHPGQWRSCVDVGDAAHSFNISHYGHGARRREVASSGQGPQDAPDFISGRAAARARSC